jgi:hypothetical protein
MNRVISIVVVLCFLLLGCATSSKDVSASYVSPLQYQNYSCEQLRQEYMRVNRRMLESAGRQDNKAHNDKVAMGVGLVLFWPALFFLAGDDHKEELARLKGECDAMESCAIQKNCTLAAEIEEARKQQEQKEKQNSRENKTQSAQQPSFGL